MERPPNRPSLELITQATSDSSDINLPAASHISATRTESSPGVSDQPTSGETETSAALERYINRHRNAYTQECMDKAWSAVATMVEKYSDQMTERWNKEIDSYRVFAGLFSAFSIQSYQFLLLPAEVSPVEVLAWISQQIASFSTSPNFLNSTYPPFNNPLLNSNFVDEQSLKPPEPAVSLNVLWFSALTLSLTSVSIGIMFKQWLIEYCSGLAGHSRSVARLRQYRLNNFEKWGLQGIFTVIPITIQLALIFFIAGVLVFLSGIDGGVTVFGVSSFIVVVYGLFVVCTTFLPLFDHGCSFITPQIRALYSIWRWLLSRCSDPRPRQMPFTSNSAGKLWSSASKLLQFPVHPSFKPRQTWQEQERVLVERLARQLDRDILLKAYTTTLNHDAVTNTAICLMDLDPRDATEYFAQLRKFSREHLGALTDAKDGPFTRDALQPLWLYILCCTVSLSLQEKKRLLSKEDIDALGHYIRGGSRISKKPEVTAEDFLSRRVTPALWPRIENVICDLNRALDEPTSTPGLLHRCARELLTEVLDKVYAESSTDANVGTSP